MPPKNDQVDEPSVVSRSSVPPEDRRRREALCDEFEARWKSGRRPRIEEFLAREAPPHDDFFTDLVKLDIDYRRRAGDPVSCERYVEQFPAYGNALAGIDWSGDPALSFLGDRYQLRGVIGHGSFGEVWRGFDTTLQRLVALKFVRGEFCEKDFQLLRREARAVAGLDHPSVVRVLDCCRGPNGAVIVFEYVDGIPLQKWAAGNAPPRETAPVAAASTAAGASTATGASATAIASISSTAAAASTSARDSTPSLSDERGPALPPAVAAGMVLQILDGVQHIHERGVVHRDLKPGNILVTPDGLPKIIDFGLSKHENVLSTLTSNDVTLLGTVAYMSPEQCQGKPLGPATDIYAIGVILYEMLTGERPFEGSRNELIQQIVAGPPARLRKADVPRPLQAICLKAMERNPARRYASAAAMAEHLRLFLDAKPLPFLMRHRELVRRARGLARIGGIGLAVAASLFAARAFLVPSQPDPRPMVVIDSRPAGAALSVFPVNRTTGQIFTDRAVRPAKSTPAELRLAPGDYLVVAALEDGSGRFHEVYRHVPVPGESSVGAFRHLRWEIEEPGRIRLPTIKIPEASVAQEMARVAGTESDGTGDGFVCGRSGGTVAPPTRVRIPDFFVDSAEVTLQQYRDTLDGHSPANRPDLNQGDPGSPVCVSFEDAVARAENLGKRLLEEAEFEFVATGRGERRFPWGDPPDGFEMRPYQDRLVLGDAAVAGLCSGHAEWTDMARLDSQEKAASEMVIPGSFPFLRPVRGGGKRALEDPLDFDIGDRDPERRTLLGKNDVRKGLGFRCGRSAAPRLRPEDFVRVVPEEAPADELSVTSRKVAP